MRPIARVGLSFVVVLSAYGVYAVTAVPLIEPSSSVADEGTPALLSSTPVSEVNPADRMYQWFGPDRHAWELQKPKMLRNDQGILLFQKYVSDPQLGPKKVRLEPVSMVFLSDDPTLDPATRERQAVILRAPTGAVLEFDRPFNLLRGDVGRLVGGVLTGEVVIHSDGKSPGPEDDLRIVTHDVKLTMSTISTNDRVRLEYGPNRCTGMELDIRLLPEEERRGTAWGSIQSLTLKRDIEVDLIVKERTEASARGVPDMVGPSHARSTEPPEFSPEQPIIFHAGSPVKLRCQGPMVFDAVEDVLGFEEQVVVERQQPGMASEPQPDKLTCQRLELHLASPDEGQKKESSTVAASKPEPTDIESLRKARSKVEVRRVVAIGIPAGPGVRSVPAVLDAPASRAFAQGHRLEYDLETRRVSLIDDKEVVFRHEGNEIHARELHYQPGPEGRLGHFEAEGGGWLNWAVRDPREAKPGAPRSPVSSPEPRRFLARWSRKLFSLPRDGRQVVSLLGEAKAQVVGMGRLDADEIHAWLIEQPQPPAPGGDAPAKPKCDLLPDRMLALAGGKNAQVVIDSPQLTGRTEKLEVFVQQAAAAAPPASSDPARVGSALPVAARPAASAAPQPQAPLREEPREKSQFSASQAAQRFDASGKRMQVQLLQVGREAQWRQIDIFGAARLVETKTAKPGELPLEVTGELVHATQEEADAARVTVSGVAGRPAKVEGRGLTLTGNEVNLDQRASHVWINGRGIMTLIVDRDLQGTKLSRPAPVNIEWRGGMRFDGQEATFERDVVVTQDRATLRTQTLVAVLNERIDLARPKQGGPRPQIDWIKCHNGLFLDRTTVDERGAENSREKLQAVDLTINQTSGAILANGPGWLTRVYRNEGELEKPGRPGVPGAKAVPAGPGFVPPAEPDKPFNYLRVDFQLKLSGNLHQRVITFSDQVQAVHAPVRRWDETVDPDRPENLGPRGAVLKCDELLIEEMRDGAGKWFEATAQGNTHVEGDTFNAFALRLEYSQRKDLLVLQGIDRAPAELWRQEKPGATRTQLLARKIEYYRRENHIKIDRAQYLDVDNIPANKGRSRPKPSGR